MPGALVYTDEDLNIVFCNDRFREMYPVPPNCFDRASPIRISCATSRRTATTAKVTWMTLVARRVESLRNPTGKSFEDQTPDGRYYRIHRRKVGRAER